jgi:hypothetical protein
LSTWNAQVILFIKLLENRCLKWMLSVGRRVAMLKGFALFQCPDAFYQSSGSALPAQERRAISAQKLGRHSIFSEAA